MKPPTLADIHDAWRAIDPLFLDSPLRASAQIDATAKATVAFKDETANPIKSFKGRGACAFVSTLSGEPHLVCASAGNFGQGIAWAARARGLSVTVFASKTAIRSKLTAMQNLGAQVRLVDGDFDDAKAEAKDYALNVRALFVEDGSETALAAGAATIALELTQTDQAYDAVFIPIGNGALAVGMGVFLKQVMPSCKVVGVVAAGAPAIATSLKLGRAVSSDTVNTIADGIAMRVPIASAVAALRLAVDEVVTVDDSELCVAMDIVKRHLALTVEPAGVAGLAALFQAPSRWAGCRVAVPLCGGNVDVP